MQRGEFVALFEEHMYACMYAMLHFVQFCNKTDLQTRDTYFLDFRETNSCHQQETGLSNTGKTLAS